MDDEISFELEKKEKNFLVSKLVYSIQFFLN